MVTATISMDGSSGFHSSIFRYKRILLYKLRSPFDPEAPRNLRGINHVHKEG